MYMLNSSKGPKTAILITSMFPRSLPDIFKALTTFQMLKCGLHDSSKKPFTIVVEGNIGSGKTTFINYFKNNDNILTLSEPIENWKNVNGHDLLYLMYKDVNKWGFTFQTYVQLTMTRLHEMKTVRPIKMMERSIYSARYCFVENLYKEGKMPPAQLTVLDEWFNWLVSRKEVSCDLIVYLRTSPEVAYERIKCRSRKGEENISKAYVEKLHECHENWLYLKNKFYCPSKVLILNADKNLETMKDEYKIFQTKLNVAINDTSHIL